MLLEERAVLISEVTSFRENLHKNFKCFLVFVGAKGIVPRSFITKWREEIARMWRFTKSNGITEGFHRKMKLIQRRAYGFRNFENYRLRVRVLCS
jgi:hypothetical protein